MNDKALLEAANLLLEAVERDGDPSYAHLCMLYRSARTKAQAEQSVKPFAYINAHAPGGAPQPVAGGPRDLACTELKTLLQKDKP
jgi:hypothetical protein